MGFLDFFKSPDINAGVKEFEATPGAVLLDVRSPQEYEYRHIPGSTNLPLQDLDQAEKRFPNKDTPLFVYCHSGARSSQAVRQLQRMGYTAAKNLGGITSYQGKIVRG